MSSCPPNPLFPPCLNQFLNDVTDQCLEDTLASLNLLQPQLDRLNAIETSTQNFLDGLVINQNQLNFNITNLTDASDCMQAFLTLVPCAVLQLSKDAVDNNLVKATEALANVNNSIADYNGRIATVSAAVSAISTEISDTLDLTNHLAGCFP